MPGPIGLNNDIGGPESFGQESGSAAYLGRISGKLLASNLERHGFDLTVRNLSTSDDTLYIDVNSKKIGINCVPTAALDVSGISKSNVMHIDSDFIIGNITANKNSLISSLVGNLQVNVSSGQGTIQFPTTVFDQLRFQSTSISPVTQNSNLVIQSNAAVELTSTSANYNVHVTNNVLVSELLTVNGTLYIGDSPVDTIVVNTGFTQDLVPHESSVYSLGDTIRRWKTLFANDLSSQSAVSSVSNLRVGNLEVKGTTREITSFNNTQVTISSNNVNVQAVSFNGNLVENLLTIANTNNGYVAFRDSSGVVIPSGTSSQRAETSTGGLRWNTSDNFLEVYTGVDFKNSLGSEFVETEEDLDDILQAYTLILG